MIKIENISKSFDEVNVLEEINLHIKKGECIVLSGVSGSGKSTLLSIIATLMKPSEGKVFLDSSDTVAFNDLKLSSYRNQKIGFITQNFHLFEMLSVKDNILPALLMSSLSHKEIHKRVENIMADLCITDKQKTIVSKLSGGEKQRCIIARALVNNPEIILYDEPTANLDKENTLQLIKIIQELKQKGKTIIIATHDPLISELDFIDRIVYISGGKIE